MNSFGRDVRFAIRTLLKSPGFTLIAIATLALGIGANSAIFSFVHGVLLKPLPYSEADRLMRVWEKAPAYLRTGSSTLNFLDWKGSNEVFEDISASTGSVMTLSGQGEGFTVCFPIPSFNGLTKSGSVQHWAPVEELYSGWS